MILSFGREILARLSCRDLRVALAHASKRADIAPAARLHMIRHLAADEAAKLADS